MIYSISTFLSHHSSLFATISSTGFRICAAFFTSFFLALVIGKWFIAKSKQFFRGKSREWTPHAAEKEDMPTMGGIFILMAVVGAVLLWCNLKEPLVWIFLGCLLSFGYVGFLDDWSKIRHRTGIAAKKKFVLQWGFALAVVVAWFFLKNPSTTVTLPLINCSLDLGLLFIPWAMFILVATSNAVNLTDGLDGLATSSLIPTYATFSLISFLAGSIGTALYLGIPFAGTSELAVVGSCLVGSLMGFLWYNAYPAQIFMGDVGALSLGGGLALMALMAKQELLLPIAGGVFVAETLSVMIQVAFYRMKKPRPFKMAPIHHHFELSGWHESKITVRFTVATLVMCVLALCCLR
jgi:phospho-N-acetylmuramoyl-pentapeptide-transferase